MTLVALACLCFADPFDDDLRRLQDLRRTLRDKRVESATLFRESHEELDRGRYESAVDKHRRSRTLQAERDALLKTEAALIETVAAALLKELDSDVVETRDRGSRLLLALGPQAVTILEKLLPGPSAETEYRLTDAVAKLRRLEVDVDGRVHQWAVTARASSEYRDTAWSAMQATGKPDTLNPGDAQTAWASLTADGGEEWLELGYDAPVFPSKVRVHETYCPGAIVKVEARDDRGAWKVIWQGRHPVKEAGGWFEVETTGALPTRAIRLTLDSAGVSGWNEIDAVELVGDSAP